MGSTGEQNTLTVPISYSLRNPIVAVCVWNAIQQRQQSVLLCLHQGLHLALCLACIEVIGNAPSLLSRTGHILRGKTGTSNCLCSSYGQERLYLLNAKQGKRNVRKAMKSVRHI